MTSSRWTSGRSSAGTTRTSHGRSRSASLLRSSRKIHDVVRQAQQAGFDAVRAGVTGGEVDSAARRVVEDAGYGDRFTHGLGHGVGLEIHEGPNFARGGEDVLPVGAVMTIEPGVYVPGLGGVRIEDMVEVEDGRLQRRSARSSRELVEL